MLSCNVPLTLVEPENYINDTPEKNSVLEAEIGNPIISKSSDYKYRAIKITQETTIDIKGFSKIINEGDIFVNNQNTDKYNLFSYYSNPFFGIAFPKENGNLAIFRKLTNGISIINDGVAVNFIDTLILEPKRKNFLQEFIYNGRADNKVKFTYREFTNDFARSAFSQDVQYDLSESQIIGFRGIRIEIISATNTILKYKVIKSFSN